MNAKLGGFARSDLDDQCLDEDLRPPGIEFFYDGAQIVVNGVGRSDNNGIGGGICLDDSRCGCRRLRREWNRRNRLPLHL